MSDSESETEDLHEIAEAFEEWLHTESGQDVLASVKRHGWGEKAGRGVLIPAFLAGTIFGTERASTIALNILNSNP